jgi:uncharacterized protein (TIGR03435 family)
MSIARIGFTLLTLALGTSGLLAQNPARPSFEVASIRPSVGVPQQGVAAGAHVDGSQFRSSFLTLKDYIAMAYRVKLYQVSGPDFIATDRFEVAGSLPDGAKTEQLPEMMQTLLDERFHLKLHRESKDFPVYALLARGPLKISESPSDPSLENVDSRAPQSFTGAGSNQGVVVNLGRGSSFSFSENKLEGKRLTMAAVAGILERFLDRPVVDMTEIKGSYDFTLDVTAEDYRSMLIRSAVVAGVVLPPEVLRILDGASAPSSLFDSLQKVGLRLEARKAPLDMLVIDSVLKTPTEN